MHEWKEPQTLLKIIQETQLLQYASTQGSVTCKYCGTVVSKTVKGSRYYSNHIYSDEGESGGSTPMETFGRGCLWLILGTLGLLLIAFITRSTINIPWFIFIPIVILVFWMASKKSK